jgi:hypothetical protein
MRDGADFSSSSLLANHHVWKKLKFTSVVLLYAGTLHSKRKNPARNSKSSYVQNRPGPGLSPESCIYFYMRLSG